MQNFTEQFERAKFAVSILQAAGYDAHLVGGALRVLAFGGVTNDIDIAVLVDGVREAALLHEDMDIVLDKLGYNFRLKHQSDYNNATAFLADWREEFINIIAYDKQYVTDINDLVNHFDLNINSILMVDGELRSSVIDIKNPVVRANPFVESKAGRLRTERVERFKVEYSHLDWSQYDDQQKHTTD